MCEEDNLTLEDYNRVFEKFKVILNNYNNLQMFSQYFQKRIKFQDKDRMLHHYSDKSGIRKRDLHLSL